MQLYRKEASARGVRRLTVWYKLGKIVDPQLLAVMGKPHSDGKGKAPTGIAVLSS